MSEIIVKKIENTMEFNAFISFGNKMYEHCPYYVPDLETELRSYFNPKKNEALKYSIIQPFIALKDGRIVGRIAGLINSHSNEQWNTRTVRFMLFDFIDDKEVSKALMSAVEDWGRQQGMDRVEGPLGFTDFDKEGMLVEDFNLMGTVNTLYNYDYYPRHMEEMQFEKSVDWIQYRIKIPKEIPERYHRTATLASRLFKLRVRTMTRHEILHEGYGQKVFELLNQAYAPLYGFTKIQPEKAEKYVKEYVNFIDLRLVPIVLNEKDELVGVAVCMGSLSKAMRKAGGKLLPTGWFHLLRAVKWKRDSTVELLLIAVRPDHQGFGVNALFFDHLIPTFNLLGFKIAETGPQLEDNKKELSQWNVLEPLKVKRRRCYFKNIKQ